MMDNFSRFFDGNIDNLTEALLKIDKNCGNCPAYVYCTRNYSFSCHRTFTEWLWDDYKEYEFEDCPFCGNDKIVFIDSNGVDIEDEDSEYEKGDLVSCYCSIHKGGCGAHSKYCTSKDDAVFAWNRRV